MSRNLRNPQVATIQTFGNLAFEPKLEHTTGGTAKCRARILCDQGKNRQGDKKPPAPYSLEFIGKRAEWFVEGAAKGDPIFVWGRLEYEEWSDRESGAQRNKNTIHVDGWKHIAWGEEAGDTVQAKGDEDDIPF